MVPPVAVVPAPVGSPVRASAAVEAGWAWPTTTIVIVIVVVVGVLVALGHEVASVLAAIGGSGYLATDLLARAVRPRLAG
jgi:hypothetical protein